MIGIVALVVGAVALPVVVRPAGATAQGASDGLIAFSTGVQVPPFGDDLSFPSDIYTIRPDGSGLRRLTHVPDGATAALPAWSPDGGAIAYERNTGGDYEIWSMGARGAGNHRVTHEAGYDHLTPSWSPDGRSIVFSRCDKPFGFVAKCSLAFVRADGTGLRTIHDDNHIDSKPVFSPDGRSVVFQSDRDGLQSAIWIVGVDGSNLRRLTSARTRAYWPDFSVDGTRVLYSNNCCLPHSDVYSVAVGGGAAVKLTNAAANQDSALGTSAPSGRSLLYWNSGADTDHGTARLVVQRADGSSHTVLGGLHDVLAADWGSAPLGPSGPSDELAVRGAAPRAAAKVDRPVSQVATAAAAPPPAADPARPGRFVYFDFQTGQLYAVSGAGGTPVQLTHTDADHAALYPGIAPNGRQIAFTRIDFLGGQPRTWIMNADGSNPHQVTGDSPDIGDLQPRFTPDGRRIVFGRCGEGCALWIMDRDGTHKHAITEFVHDATNEVVDFDPVVSPDGTQVAFTRFLADGFNARVFVADIDGGHVRAVTAGSLEAADPTYIGDGTSLAFTDRVNRLGTRVWRSRPDGSALRRLTDTRYPNLDYAASGSPDGTQIGFASDRRYDDFCCGDIFTMRLDGSNERQVATGDGLGVADLEWGLSPTGATSSPSSSVAGDGRSQAPCPTAPGSLRLVPCSVGPTALVHRGFARR